MAMRNLMRGMLIVAAMIIGGLFTGADAHQAGRELAVWRGDKVEWQFTGADAHAAGPGQPTDWQRFYYYPYVYYPQNFRRLPESFDHLYYRYPVEMQIPVYRTDWHNFYPSERPYHSGHHFILDVF